MRLRNRRSPLLLLLVHTLAVSAAVAAPPAAEKETTGPAVRDSSTSGSGSAHKFEIGTKDAPVDGKDGRPHSGPFVEIENLRKDEPDTKKERPALKDKPADITVHQGEKIPEKNDGVMFDPNRPEPKEGTTGTSDGVSEKHKAEKAQEAITGEKAEKRPDAPKEAPPLPHSEQEKIMNGGDKKEKEKLREKLELEKAAEKKASGDKSDKDSDNKSGDEKPDNLPGESTHPKGNPPVSGGSGSGSGSKTPSKPKTPGKPIEDDDGVIQPFHSFVLSLAMILFAEVGDKTFLIAALMAMKHDRIVVFTAAFSALVTMTVLSAVLGHAVPTLIPKNITSFLAAGLFFVFGIRLMREGLAMSKDEGVGAEMQEVEMELAEKENQAREKGKRRSSHVSPYALEMGLGNGRQSRSKSRFPTPPRSPSVSPGRSPSPQRNLAGFITGLSNLMSLLLSPAWVQTFVMTFLGEWGDRSQIATIAMAAGQDYWWVTLGALLGHACCTGVAVVGGRAIAGRVSMRVVTLGGACAFLVFGFIYTIEAFYS